MLRSHPGRQRLLRRRSGWSGSKGRGAGAGGLAPYGMPGELQDAAPELDLVARPDRRGRRDPMAVDERSVRGPEVFDHELAAGCRGDPRVLAGDLRVAPECTSFAHVAAELEVPPQLDRGARRRTARDSQALVCNLSLIHIS